MEQALNSTRFALFKSHLRVNAPTAYLSVSRASVGVKEHLDVEMVDAVPKVSPAEPDVTFTKSAEHLHVSFSGGLR